MNEKQLIEFAKSILVLQPPDSHTKNICNLIDRLEVDTLSDRETEIYIQYLEAVHDLCAVMEKTIFQEMC